MYCDVYKERLPQDWLTIAKDKNNTGLVFDNLCADKWTITLMDEVSLNEHLSIGHLSFDAFSVEFHAEISIFLSKATVILVMGMAGV